MYPGDCVSAFHPAAPSCNLRISSHEKNVDKITKIAVITDLLE